MTRTFQCRTEQDTESLGERFGRGLFGGAFVALNGGLGAGKTAFTRGVGRALGAFDVASPTFLIVQEHDTTPRLYHFDAYRLADADELAAMGFADYLTDEGAVLMEWAELVSEALPKERLELFFAGDGLSPRTVTATAYGERYQRWLESV